MVEWSEAALRLQVDVIGKPEGPRVLFDAWTAGVVSDGDLRNLIPDAWMRSGNGRPEQVAGTRAWVTMFRAAGFVAQPTYLIALVDALTVYRGAPEQRSRGMAWSSSIDKAEQFRQRCEKFGETAFLYVATAPPVAVLGLFDSSGEQEVVVDPQFLRDHRMADVPA